MHGGNGQKEMAQPAMKWMRRNRSLKGKQAGSTITEVVVSFAALMLLAAMAAQVFLTAWQLTLDAVSRVRQLEAVQEAVYLDKYGNMVKRSRLGTGNALYFALTGKSDEGGADGFYLEGMAVYRYGTAKEDPALYRLEEENGQ